jgi:phosphoribosylamine--glycine ligase
MKYAIIGSGGREHAIAWKLSQTVKTEDIFLIPGNGGTQNNVGIDYTKFKELKSFAIENDIKLIIVGPEAPLVDGIVDYFEDTDIFVFGPNRKAAKIEGSKIWAKKFMKKYNVSTSDFWVFENNENPHDIIEGLDGSLVVKYDGLAGGKGVFVCSSIAEAENAILNIKMRYGSNAKYLIEEKLSGQEISIIGVTDGKSINLLLPSQDHKPIYDDDKGPNTGGMGAYCPVPFCTNNTIEQIKKYIVEPTLKGIQEERLNYKGVIYFGLIITNEGPKVLEYNVRFGDPETEVILPALKSDLCQLIFSCFNQKLDSFQMEFFPNYFVDIVLASEGYPGVYKTGYEITGLDRLASDTLVFHAGTKRVNDKMLTSGGRVLNIVSKGSNLKSAIDNAYTECAKVKFKNVYFRRDIGQKGLRD